MSARLAAAVTELVAAIRDEVRTQSVTAPMAPRAYSVAEAAKAIGISRSELYKHVRTGMLRTHKIGARRVVTAAALDDFLGGASPPGAGA